MWREIKCDLVYCYRNDRKRMGETLVAFALTIGCCALSGFIIVLLSMGAE